MGSRDFTIKEVLEMPMSRTEKAKLFLGIWKMAIKRVSYRLFFGHDMEVECTICGCGMNPYVRSAFIHIKRAHHDRGQM